MTKEKEIERREIILEAAQWCFLNFGFAKTSFEDIARRANLSRTLLYKVFKSKEDIFTAVFANLLMGRHPAAQEAAVAPGSPYDRLIGVCRLMVLEPYSVMARTPMGSEFFDVCERLDPAISELHRQVALQCVASILGEEEIAEIFLLAMDGLLADEPSSEILEHRTRILAGCFVQAL